MNTKLALRKMLACGLMVAALAMTANAQDVTVRGSGTCQEYLDAKRSNDVQEAVKDFTWLLGYLSGLAVVRHVNILGKDNSVESMLDWVDAYCGRYPAKYLSDAGDLFYTYRVEQMKAASYPK